MPDKDLLRQYSIFNTDIVREYNLLCLFIVGIADESCESAEILSSAYRYDEQQFHIILAPHLHCSCYSSCCCGVLPAMVLRLVGNMMSTI